MVTGATGHTGSQVYLTLQQQGVNVRGLVRNISKARSLLKCTACNASDGIYVGDITRPETLGDAMDRADGLVITTCAEHSACHTTSQSHLLKPPPQPPAALHDSSNWPPPSSIETTAAFPSQGSCLPLPRAIDLLRLQVLYWGRPKVHELARSEEPGAHWSHSIPPSNPIQARTTPCNPIPHLRPLPQVSSFANSTLPTGLAWTARHVVLLSNDLTTTPDNFLDKIDNGHGCFYALNG